MHLAREREGSGLVQALPEGGVSPAFLCSSAVAVLDRRHVDARPGGERRVDEQRHGAGVNDVARGRLDHEVDDFSPRRQQDHVDRGVAFGQVERHAHHGRAGPSSQSG